MISGYDRYYQIVKCFRDEDLRADRQPEFTQIDCEMSFVHQEDILNTFESLTKHLFITALGVNLTDFPRMTYDEALRDYGSDKPDLRFGMQDQNKNDVLLGSLAFAKNFDIENRGDKRDKHSDNAVKIPAPRRFLSGQTAETQNK